MKTKRKEEVARRWSASAPCASRAVRAGAIVGLLGALACDPAGELGSDEPAGEVTKSASALVAAADTYFGTLTHVSPVTAKHTNMVSGWQLIPGLAGAIQSEEGDNLQIRVSAEMLGGSTAYLRAKVDGAGLDWVIFKRSGESSDEVRDFTFVQRSVTEGQHIVEIEWWAEDDVMIRARTMALESLPPSMSQVASATGEIEKTSDTWEDVPGMAKTVTTTTAQDFAITFSADSVADSGRLLVQALVDGSKVSEVAFVEAGSGARYGARSYTFIRKNLPADDHHVRIQWRVESGKARLGTRTLALTAGRPTGAAGLEMVGLNAAPVTYTSTEYVTVMNDWFTTQGANTSAILSFGAEIKATGRAYVRALVDGVETSPTPVQLAHGGGSFRVASYAFRATNLPPGRHKVEFQISVDGGASATLRRKFHRVLYRPRSGAELVRPLDGMKPRHQARQLLAICFDPVRPEHPRPSKAMLREILEGIGGGLSVMGWFANNSAGRLEFDAIRYVGCDDGSWFLAPPAHRGNWYWDHDAFDLMWREALQAADGEVDFHAYDYDNDQFLSPDEVGVMIIRPQNTASGFVRATSTYLDGWRTKLGVRILDLYLSSDPLKRRSNLGVTAHEMNHAFLDAWDLHSCDAPVSANAYSIMDEHQWATSIDPFHKLKSGWVTPSLIDIPTTANRFVGISSVSATGNVVILQNRARGDGEYFILENRAPGDLYDAPMLDSGTVVWQVFEDESIDAIYPPPGSETCPRGRTRIRRLGMLKSMYQAMDLNYADGTSTGVRLQAASSAGSTMTIMIQPR